MLSSHVALAIFTVIAAAAAAPLDSTDGWRHVGQATGSELMKLTFAVKLTNTEWLTDFVDRVSYPQSPQYGQHLSFEELARIVHGDIEHHAAVMSLLSKSEVTAIDTVLDRGYIVATMSAQQATAVLGVDMSLFEHSKTGLRVARALGAGMPSHLSAHCDFVSGHDKLPTMEQRGRQVKQGAPLEATTPKVINDLYSLENYIGKSKNNSQAVASFLKEYFNEADLATFQSHFSLANHPIDKVVGVNKDSRPGLEAELDVQYITAVGRGIDTWFVSTGTLANHGQEDFLAWVIDQTNTSDSPWVHSVSYGDVESSIDETYLFRLDIDLQKFAASGRTVLVAAGDSGVGPCKGDHFEPDWPVSSPHVTAVGGTTLEGSAESVWSSGGGGFSNRYAQPAFQKDAVAAYLKSGQAPDTSKFNVSGRAYPDVAALATNFEICSNKNFFDVDGTSCATPTFAGVVALLNDVRLAAGKPTLGWLNPLIYSLDKSSKPFQDITKGSNPGPCREGFQSTQGWDPATGWGSPNFSSLKTLV